MPLAGIISLLLLSAKRSGILISGLDDLDESLRVEGGAANQAAIHVRLGQEFLGVLLVHGPAVLDGDGSSHMGAVQPADNITDSLADLAGLLGSDGRPRGPRWPGRTSPGRR